MSPNDSVRVRFAPSPTGFLHIGGVRAALFNWLFARHHGGKYLLRIEDTDLERSETRFTDDILACMKWVGLNWDEELVFQSKRLDHYREIAEQMVTKGKAYRCYCSAEEVDQMREQLSAEGKKPRYNGKCRNRKDQPAGASYVIRVKIPETGFVEFDDLIRGKIRFENAELDDFILVRSQGAPTYNLTVVVDDVEMRMTHIIRGDDHINNTPKQIHLYQAMDYPIPLFAHLPMILGEDKKKLSKRHGDVSANYYRGEGYLPEALLNFLVRLGWSHGDQEIFTIEEMVQHFDFDHVQKASAVFNSEKLLWLNGEHIRRAAPNRLASIVSEDFKDVFAAETHSRVSTPIGVKLVALIQPKVKLVKEIADQLAPLCRNDVPEVDASGLKWNKKPEMKPVLKSACSAIYSHYADLVKKAGPARRTGVDTLWGDSPSLSDLGQGHAEIEAFLRQTGDARGVKLGELVEPMRLSITGRMVSASVFEVMAVLPWEILGPRLARIESL